MRRGFARDPGRRANGGYITVVVLTFAGLMAALVAATLNVARPSVGQALVNIDEMQADALLEAGVAAAGYALYGNNRPIDTVDGLELPLETGTVRLKVLPEGSRIDLNGAPPVLLSGLYQAAGSGALKPEEFAALVLDWRDRNSNTRAQGAEAPEYSGQGLPYGPRNGPFLSLEDMLLMPGMTDEDFDLLMPYLTVFNPIGEIDPAGAGMPVMMAVPDMTEKEAADIKDVFDNPESSRRDLNQAIRPFGRYLTSTGTDVFRVIVEARLNNGYVKSVETVLMAGFRRIPYYVLYWRVFDRPEVAS
jgi:general secretion pathway protein K